MWVPKPTSFRASRSRRSHFPDCISGLFQRTTTFSEYLKYLEYLENGSADGNNDKRPCENEVGSERHVKTVEAMK